MKTIFIVLLFGPVIFTNRLGAQSFPGGRTIRVRLQGALTTKSAASGDSVSARLAQPLTNHNNVNAPAGTLVEGRVDFVQGKSVTEDGWMRLLFNRMALPDGREIHMIALASFFRPTPHGKRDHILAITGFAAAGLLIGGHNERAVGGLGGAIAGLVFAENKSPVGQDLTLHAGQTIRLLLIEDSFREK